MSKPIRMTSEVIEKLIESLRTAAQTIRVQDGKFKFETPVDQIDAKATLTFAEKAWFKMVALTQSFDTEAAWHGVARRVDKGEYVVDDIIVYPQEVSGATVTTDQTKYQTWLMNLDDDVFNNMRFQGHSHVNMGVSPSSVDLTNYDKLLDQLGPEDFYIFMIVNKKFDKTIKIYDYRDNILYETGDVTVKVQSDFDIEGFLAEARGLVATRTVTVAPVTTTASQTARSPWTPKPKKEKHTGKPATSIWDVDDDDEFFGNYSKYYYGTY